MKLLECEIQNIKGDQRCLSEGLVVTLPFTRRFYNEEKDNMQTDQMESFTVLLQCFH